MLLHISCDITAWMFDNEVLSSRMVRSKGCRVNDISIEGKQPPVLLLGQLVDFLQIGESIVTSFLVHDRN